MKYPINLKALLLSLYALLSIQVSVTIAKDYCHIVNEPSLKLGCARTFTETLPLMSTHSNPSTLFITQIIGSYNGLVFDSDWMSTRGEKRIRFFDDTYFTSPQYAGWENMYFGSVRSDGKKTALDMIALKTGLLHTDHLVVEVQFDRLTIENTALIIKDAQENNGQQTGKISDLTIGHAYAGRGGGLTLRNGTLEFFQSDTKFHMAAPGNAVPFIRAESGDNLLKIQDQSNSANKLSLQVNDNAKLTFEGTTLTASNEGSLTVGEKASLNVDKNSIVRLEQNSGSSLPRSTVKGGHITVKGEKSELRLTAPLFTDSTILLDNGGTLRSQQRDDSSSSLSFSGKNKLHFGNAQAAVLGSVIRQNDLKLEIGPGTTVITSANVMSLKRGLQVNQIHINGGTLDTTGYWGANETKTNALLNLMVKQGGTFYDRHQFYDHLQSLEVNSGTLKSHSTFGSFTVNSGIKITILKDSIIDLVSAHNNASSSNLPTGLNEITLNTQYLKFSGVNKVCIGISPAGESVKVAGIPVPASYSGQLVVNVGGAVNPKIEGFGTVLFVPSVMDKNAVAADYVTGGNNGVYTVARANHNADLTYKPQSFDAAPMTPTVSQLIAAGSNLPANLIYAIVNDPVKDERVDISFVDVSLQNHPLLTTGYTKQFTNTVVVDPNTNNAHAITVSVLPDVSSGVSNSWTLVEPSTGNTTTITQTAVVDPSTGASTQKITTVVTTPGGAKVSTGTVNVPSNPNSGGAVQLVTTTVTKSDGSHVQTTTAAASLGKPVGTINKQSYSLLFNSPGHVLTHADLSWFETLHPEAYASYMTVALEQSDHLRNMVLVNARGNGAGGDIVATGGDRVESMTSDGRRIWFDTAIMRGEVDARRGMAGFDYYQSEAIFGTDLWSNDELNLGVCLGVGRYSMDKHSLSTQALKFSSNSYHIGGYGNFDTSSWSFTSMMGVSWAKTKATREAITGAGSNIHKANYDSTTFETAMRAEYLGIAKGRTWKLLPEVGCGYAQYNQDAIIEKGPVGTALNIKKVTAKRLIGSVGLNMIGPELCSSLEPVGFVRYEHDFLADHNKEHSIDAAFISSPGVSQPFTGTHRGSDAVSVGIGLQSAFNSSIHVSVGLVHTKNTYGSKNGGSLNVTWIY